MRQLARVLIGYRDDWELQHHWWHRLWNVAIVASSCLLFIVLLDTRRPLDPEIAFRYALQSTPTPWDPVYAVSVAGIVTALYILIIANLYYRGIVYIIKGRRG